MICPRCGCDNVPGTDTCARCQLDLAPLDAPCATDRVQTSLTEDPVGRLRPAAPVTVPATATLGEAMAVMVEHHVGSVLAIDAAGRLVGILSERDLLMRVAGLYPESYRELPVSGFMTPEPVTVRADDSLARALHKMDLGGYRHLPVVHDGKPVGVVSVRDLMRHITRLCRSGP